MSAELLGDQEVIGQLPGWLQGWLELERFHLHKAELFLDRSRDPAFDPKYFPQNCGAVRLPCYWIERRHLHVFGIQPTGATQLDFVSGDGPDSSVLFPMHPDSVPHYLEVFEKLGARDAARDGVCIWGVPTSSTRTFLAWPDGMPVRAVFVKTSLHSPILGDRRLFAWKIARSVGLSRMVQESPCHLPNGLGYFPELLAFVPRLMPDSGVIIRSIPEEIKAGQLRMLPLFALMGSRHTPPLLMTLLERMRLQPREFLEEVLCARFAALWLKMCLQHGLILEAHGQDLLLAMSPDLRSIESFYYRDFEGMHVDWELRRRRGLPQPRSMPYCHAWHEAYNTWGYRCGQLVSYKLAMSLGHYSYLVLAELEQMLRAWQERGIVGGARLSEDDLTWMFSRKMIDLIAELFGVHVAGGDKINVYRHPNRFVLLLLSVRRELIERSSHGRVSVPCR